jgi:hypothetical protein
MKEERMAKSTGTTKSTTFNWALILIGVVAVAAALWFFFFRGAAPATATSGEIEELIAFPNIQSGHEEGFLNYDRYPPAGGIHNPHWWSTGIYDEQIPVEKAVHTLEHGGVWITYHPADTTPEEIETLRALVRGRPCVMLSPGIYGGQATRVSAVAWGYAIDTEDANDPRLPVFISRFAQGPQAPEQGASCSDEGVPIE